MEFAVVPAPACADPRTISPMVPKKRKKPNHDGRANCKNCNNKILAPRPGLEPGTYGLTVLVSFNQQTRMKPEK